jgi:nucleoside-diphosphate-sugar epimerase
VSMRYFARTGTYSIEKARRLLGYRPAVDLAEGMARTEQWLRAEGLLP